MEYYGNNDWRDYVRSRNDLAHFGTPKHSGRYPWGSGENPYHHGEDSPRKRYKNRKADIKREVNARRGAFGKEAEDYVREFNKTHKKGRKLSDEDRRRGEEFSKDFNKRWAESEEKYKSDLKSAKDQYRLEKKQARAEKTNNLKRSIGNAAGTYLQKSTEMKRAIQDERVNKDRAYYDAILREKTLGRALKTSLLGNDKLRAANARIEADTHDRLAKSAFTKIVANEQSNRAANKRHMADYYDKRSKMSGGQRIKEAVFKTEYYKTPYTRIDGKTTTIGGEKLRELRNEVIWNTSMYLLTGQAHTSRRNARRYS